MNPRPPTPIREPDAVTSADSPLPSGQHQAALCDTIKRSILGPMPPQEFLSNFFSPQSNSPPVPSSFNQGIFDPIVEIMMNNKPEKELYQPFVSFYCCTSWPEVNMGNQCDILKPFISNFTMCDTSCHPNKATTDYAFSIKPDCTMYNEDNGSVGGTNATLAEVFVKFKRSPQYDPFHATPSAKNSCISDTPDARKVVGQIGTYVAVLMDSRHLTHVFFVLVIYDYAYLMRWDRRGAVFTERIYYNTQPEFLQFFEAYTTTTPEARGHDPFVTKATSQEVSAASAKIEATIIKTGFEEEINNSQPLFVVSMPELYSEPPRCRRYVIRSFIPRPVSPFGRSTRTFIAYDLQSEECVVMKDSWRVDATNAPIEGEIYRSLNQEGVKNVPKCVGFCDVGEDKYHRTQTQSFSNAPWLGSFDFSSPALRHHRLILKTVGRKLDKFRSSRELVCAIRAALIGMSFVITSSFARRLRNFYSSQGSLLKGYTSS
jgi:Fungal protein kinase